MTEIPSADRGRWRAIGTSQWVTGHTTDRRRVRPAPPKGTVRFRGTPPAGGTPDGPLEHDQPGISRRGDTADRAGGAESARAPPHYRPRRTDAQLNTRLIWSGGTKSSPPVSSSSFSPSWETS
jgi:hypothetical protein